MESDDKQTKWLPKRDQDKGQRLEAVQSFTYLGATISNEGSKPEILSRIARTTEALSRLKIIWGDKKISLASNVKLMRTLILSTFLYACESWTLAAELERRIQALKMKTAPSLISSHLSPLILEVVGAPEMTLQQYLPILPCFPLPSGNLQTPFPSIP